MFRVLLRLVIVVVVLISTIAVRSLRSIEQREKAPNDTNDANDANSAGVDRKLAYQEMHGELRPLYNLGDSLVHRRITHTPSRKPTIPRTHTPSRRPTIPRTHTPSRRPTVPRTHTPSRRPTVPAHRPPVHTPSRSVKPTVAPTLEPCVIGYYMSGGHCLSCPLGQTTVSVGATSVDQCVCAIGHPSSRN